jgi:hypothetical protein
MDGYHRCHQGGFSKELVGITKYEKKKKVIQMEVTLNENNKERD